MNPTPSDVHVNQMMTQISLAYFQDTDGFVADRVFLNVPVDHQSDRYWVYNRGDFNRDEMEMRAPATESAGGGWNLDNTPTYFANVWAFHKDIDDQTRANADAAIRLDSDSTEYCSLKALIRKERVFAQQFFQASLWNTQFTGNANPSALTGGTSGTFQQWSNPASTPIEDIRKAKTLMQLQGGMRPNVLTVSQQIWDTLMDHPDFIERIKYGGTNTDPAEVNRQAVASLFEVEEVLVMSAIYNLAAEGLVESNAFIGGNSALLSYRPPSPGLMTPSAGYTFSWNGYMGATGLGSRILTFRIEQIKSTRIEIEMAFDMRVTSADLGVFFSNVV